MVFTAATLMVVEPAFDWYSPWNCRKEVLCGSGLSARRRSVKRCQATTAARLVTRAVTDGGCSGKG